ncbi:MULTISPECIES: GPW/gp25 family protein [Wolbachia]|uniref:GPW/gp25 family protein n=1 Tax=Candidatus Wolbachia massiliensis TaxID=1845000 RepID=A0A7L7YLJ0_9RICK|nr:MULTISPECIES: GPW/gp25 family protein [Wolbachia]QOD38120.1 GPW/gp25 family protein [Candidatus Wolbachia massiliensis]GKS79133.1 bacteriophage protein [Wolbachia pipientis]
MRGMNSETGKTISGIEHLKQSIVDILTTPIGTRVMRRDYGSRLFELIDHPIVPGFAQELYAAVAEALEKWERRFKLKRVQITEIKEGKVTLILEGIYLPNGKLIRLDGIIV